MKDNNKRLEVTKFYLIFLRNYFLIIHGCNKMKFRISYLQIIVVIIVIFINISSSSTN